MAGYQVIARKYRPRTFEEVVGQEAVARTLRNAIESDRVAHAYMFCGPRGVGKTSMARILAKALNCLRHEAPTPQPCGECELCVAAATGDDLDVFEMDAASNRKVDDARNLIANVAYQPSRARFKVYIVDEVHMLTTEAFNALLKTLEEPPGHVKFVFATTDPQKVPATILSRCQRFDFRPVPAPDIAALLARICEREGVEAEQAALVAIARASAGGVRDAESLLEQLTTLGRGAIRLEDLHALLGTVSGERMRALFDAVACGAVAEALEVAGDVLDAGTDPGELLRQCMRHAHDLLLVKVQGPGAAGVVADDHTRQALAAQAAQLSDATLAYSVTLFSEALKNARLLGEGRLFAETAVARLAGHRDMSYLDQIARDLAALEKRLGVEPAASPQRSAGPPGQAGQGAAAPDRARTGRAPQGRAAQGRAPQGSAAQGSAAQGRDDPGPAASGPATSGPATSGLGGAAPAQSTGPSPSGPSNSGSSSSGSGPATSGPYQEGPRSRGAATAVAEAPPGAPPAASPATAEPEPAEPPPVEPHGGHIETPPAAAPEPAPTDALAGREPVRPDERAPGPEADEPLDLRRVQARWSEVREVARQASSRLMAHLQPARVESFDSDVIELSFPVSGAYHRTALDGGELADGLDAALAAVFGRRLRVRTVERPDDPETADADQTRRRRRDLLNDRLSAAEVAGARDAPLSKLMHDSLGAKIVHLEREP